MKCCKTCEHWEREALFKVSVHDHDRLHYACCMRKSRYKQKDPHDTCKHWLQDVTEDILNKCW